MNIEKQMTTTLLLLTRLAEVAKKNREALARSEWNFNVFRLCGVNHYENANSRILAEFLSPQGSHGMGAVFLERFLSAQNIPFAISAATEVLTEFADGHDRMDIVIQDRDLGWCVVIENKIYAREQEDQLPRYWKWLTNNYCASNSRLLFLTLDGYASETAENGKKNGGRIAYTPISYDQDILHWLGECIRLTVERPFVRETLRQYRNHIQWLTGKSLEREQMQEVVDLLANADNFEAAQLVYTNYSGACQHIVADILKDVAKEVEGVCEIAPESEAPTLNSKEDGFYFIELQTRVRVLVAPEGKNYSNFFVGVRQADAQNFADTLRSEMCKKGEGWGKSDWWPAYKYLPSQFSQWNGDILLQSLREPSFRAKLIEAITSLLTDICDVLKDSAGQEALKVNR